MPALTLFNRRWLLATDDIPLPAAVLAVFHLAWVGLLIGWIVAIQGPEDCEGVSVYYAAVGGLLGFFALAFVLEVAAAIIGFRGAIFEVSKRKPIKWLIYGIALSVVGQIVFNSYCTYLVYQEPPECQQGSEIWDPVDVLYGLVISTWVIIAGLIFLLVVCYNMFPDYNDPEAWERQCRCLSLTCCQWALTKQEREQRASTASRLGELCALVFGHIDFTPTDVLLAFGLALTLTRGKRKQAEKLRQSRKHYDARLSSTEQEEEERANGKMHEDESIHVGAAPGTMYSMTGKQRQDSLPPASAAESNSFGSGDELLSGYNTRAAHRELDIETGLRASSSSAAATRNNDNEHLDGDLSDIGSDGEEDGLVDDFTLKECAHYCKFAFAAYGWMLYMWQKRAGGFVQLCCGRGCGLCVGIARGAGTNYKTVGKGSILNREVILQAAGIKETDLIFTRHEGEIPKVLPYFVAIDNETNSVVVAIRGSLSMQDLITDLLFEPAELDDWVAPNSSRSWTTPPPQVLPASNSSRFAAHSGILEAARATLVDIQDHGRLKELLRGDTNGSNNERKLVICGHSLGAGAAFLISLYMRQDFPGLRCFSFSPPGGLATAELCKESEEWCTSIVCGKEWIPRLSFSTFENFRDSLVLAAVRCRQPKLNVFSGWIRGRTFAESELFHDPGCVPDEPIEFLRQYKESLGRSASIRQKVHSATDFGPPGRLFWLKPTGVEKNAGKKGGGTSREYKAVWIQSSELIDDGIIISSRMMADHMPDYLLGLLRRLAVAREGMKQTACMTDAGGEQAVRNAVTAGGDPEEAERQRRVDNNADIETGSAGVGGSVVQRRAAAAQRRS